MTEKRFQYNVNKNTIEQDGKFVAYMNSVDGVRIANKLNVFQKENEELKSTIKEVTELLSDEVDLFSDKATEHDLNAYRELNQLDNKDAYYMATATKKAIKMLKELQ